MGKLTHALPWLFIHLLIYYRPGSFAHFAEHGVGRYSNDGVTENLNLYEFVVQDDLYDAVNRHMSVFTAETGSGCVILLYSLLLTRGLEK